VKFTFLGSLKKATKSKSDKNIVLILIKQESCTWDSFLMNGVLQKFLRVKNLNELDEKCENMDLKVDDVKLTFTAMKNSENVLIKTKIVNGISDLDKKVVPEVKINTSNQFVNSLIYELD
jgi:hypothetical protein